MHGGSKVIYLETNVGRIFDMHRKDEHMKKGENERNYPILTGISFNFSEFDLYFY